MSGPIPLQNVGSLTQVVSSPLTALKPQPPLLTPSLAKLYRESLISHCDRLAVRNYREGLSQSK